MSAKRRGRRPDRAALRGLMRLGGARLCYGRPVRAGDRTVITVASVRAIGGGGYGRDGTAERPEELGGGGGGLLLARPVGFIEVGPEGASFHAIGAGRRIAVGVALGAGTMLLAGLAGRGGRLSPAALRRPGAGRRRWSRR